MVMGRRASTSSASRSRSSGPLSGVNNFGSEKQTATPNLLNRRVAQDDSDCVTKHSSATQVRSNTSKSRRATETSVSKPRDNIEMAEGTSKDEGGRHRPIGSGTASNTSRLAPVDHVGQNPNRRATDMPSKTPSMRRVNTASGALEKVGNHNFEQQKVQPTRRLMRRNSTGVVDHKAVEDLNLSWRDSKVGNHNFEQQKVQPTRRLMRRNSTGVVDHKAVKDLNLSWRDSKVSKSYDDLYSLNRGRPSQSRRSSIGTSSDKSYKQRSSSRGSRRRTTRGSDRSRRRTTRSSAGSGGDIYEELHQLRIEHYRMKQELQPVHRRRSSLTNSDLSLDLDYDIDEEEIAVISAPLGRRLSNATNPNSEMGEFLREAAYEANKSEDSEATVDRLYMGKMYDPTRSSRHSLDLPLNTSRHSSVPSETVSTVPSDRTNDQKMYNDLLRGKAPRRGRKPRCYARHSVSKWTIIIALGLVVLASLILGAVLLERERGIGLGFFKGVEKNLPGPGANVHHVKPPPSDIDGRCSSSNLPGSLPACLEACYPASCCYGNSNSGTKCLDPNDPESVKACQRYRPHCDIFHDTWDGATDGVLRTPRADLVPICQEVNGKGANQSSNLRARNMLVETAEDVCSQYCEAAKCCAKDTVFDPNTVGLDGLELSASGVYTDAKTKEYVVTNCQDDLVFQKNKDLCAEYDKFCTWDDEDVAKSEKSDEWTSRPTMDPASTMTPSTSPSIVPSVSPSMTLQPSPFTQKPSHAPSMNALTTEWITKRPVASPSIAPSNSNSPSHKFKPSSQPSLSSMPTISRANITLIEAACTGADNIALMAEGDETARTKCLDACSNGLCCYTEQLGYPSSESCYIGNEAMCEEYSACLWLKESGELTLDSTSETNPNEGTLNTVSNGTVIFTTDVNSKLSAVFNETIATDNNSTSLDTSTDETSAPSSTPSSVSSETATILNGTQYADSTNTTSSAILAIPPPPVELAALCALGGGRFCADICEDVSCCFEETPELSCFSANTEICEGYAPCSVLYPQGGS